MANRRWGANKEKPRPTSIRLQPWLKEELKKEADKRSWGVAGLMQRILEQWVKRVKGKEI